LEDKMKYILVFLISLLFFGCGDGEDRVASSSKAADANVLVPLEVGETKTFALNLNVEKSYMVKAESANSDKKVAYRVDYLNRTYPEIVITGVSAGTEYFTVTAEEANGLTQSALIRADVNVTDANASNYIDIATGGSAGGVIPPDNGGGGGGGGGTTPPVINPISDPNACLENDPTWGSVGDSWGTTEGQFSQPDLHYWIRSQISEEPSNIVLYYHKETAVANGYISLGRYTYYANDGYVLKFDMQMVQALLGKYPYFYVKARGDCFRGNIPTSPLMAPDKKLTPVFTGSLF